MKILITGGAGFIGSALIRYILNSTEHQVINLDKLTYAGNLDSLDSVSSNKNYVFENRDICSFKSVASVFKKHKPDGVMHLAAESHVDRSIDAPENFLKTNIFGTYNLLEATKDYLNNYNFSIKPRFIFHHISTDEVFGDLDSDSDPFTEETAYDPSSPYSASKASSDHLVRAWGRTYDLPFVITNTSNNYGPFHFPEKFIPHTILNAIQGLQIPIYGDGTQVRDWLYVEDHVKALIKVFELGLEGSTYNIGGNNQITNLQVVKNICNLLEELRPLNGAVKGQYEDLINFVDDRPGHDKRYSIDSKKIHTELSWQPEETFESGLRKTVKWYLKNEEWWNRILNGNYKLDRIGDKL